MLKQHKAVLTKNHDFLVSEVPMDATLDALRPKKILTWHDFDQLRTLRHQGRRALARYLLGVLPYRGSEAFDAFLQSLQEANAQHIVDLLLEERETFHTPAVDEEGNPVTPGDTPLPQAGPDPHEYVIRLSRNNKLIREFVQPAHVCPVLAQNRVMSAREADMLGHLHGRNKKWDLIMAVLLQRGERAYQAFMASLLQHGYSAIFHTIQETSTELSQSEDEAEEYAPPTKRESRVRKSTTAPIREETNDDVIESDEEIKEELASKKAEEDPWGNSRLDSGVDANDPLLRRSRDLQDDQDGGGSLAGNDQYDTLSNDTDLNGYVNFDDDDDGDRNSIKSNTSRLKRNQRRKSNTSLALNSVKEEEAEETGAPNQRG